MANPFVHIELSTTDVGKAKSFYGKLFDWDLEDVPMGEAGAYTMIKVGEGTGGGLVKQLIPGAPSALAGLRSRRRHQVGDQQGQVAWGKSDERRNGGNGRRLAQHHRRPDRRPRRLVATEEGLNPSSLVARADEVIE